MKNYTIISLLALFLYTPCYHAYNDPNEGVVYYATESNYADYKDLLTGYTLFKSSRAHDLEKMLALSLYYALDEIRKNIDIRTELSPKEKHGYDDYLKLCAQLIINVPKKVASASDYVFDILNYGLHLTITKNQLHETKSAETKKRIIDAKLALFNNRYTPVYETLTKKYNTKTKLPSHLSFDMLKNKGR